MNPALTRRRDSNTDDWKCGEELSLSKRLRTSFMCVCLCIVSVGETEWARLSRADRVDSCSCRDPGEEQEEAATEMESGEWSKRDTSQGKADRTQVPTRSGRRYTVAYKVRWMSRETDSQRAVVLGGYPVSEETKRTVDGAKYGMVETRRGRRCRRLSISKVSPTGAGPGRESGLVDGARLYHWQARVWDGLLVGKRAIGLESIYL